MKRGWFDEARHLNQLFWGLAAVCGLLVVVDLFMRRHAHFHWEEIPGMYAAIGFVSFFAIVMAGRWLRGILQRDEDYYDR
jgi:hypothetical protein